MITNLAEAVKEWFRPELKMDHARVEREILIRETDDTREQWLCDYIVLVEGDFMDLVEKRPGPDPDGTPVGFATNIRGKYRQHKRVYGYADAQKEDEEIAKRNLKFALHERGANSGIYYQLREKKGILIASAVPTELGQLL